MATTFGFSTTLGYINPTLEEMTQHVADLYFAATGIIVDLEQVSPTLDQIRSIARTMKAAYDDQGGTYNSGFVGSAGGAGLQNLISPFIGAPLPNTGSTVVLDLTGVAATVVGAGSTVLLGTDGPGAAPWVLDAPVVLPGSGTFTYSVPGPKSAAAGSSWAIGTPVVGWSGATNPAVADLGRLAETELEYKARYKASVQGTRIAASVLAVDGVTSVLVFENPTDIHDSFWGATHWIEVLVEGGVALAIATAIQASRAYTVQTLGSEFVPVPFANVPGGTVTIRYSIPAPVDAWVELTITKGENYSTDTSTAAVAARELAIRNQILAWAALREPGLDAFAFQVASIADATPGVPGIGNIVSTIGPASPPLDQVLIAGPRDLLVFDAARIILNGV